MKKATGTDNKRAGHETFISSGQRDLKLAQKARGLTTQSRNGGRRRPSILRSPDWLGTEDGQRMVGRRWCHNYLNPFGVSFSRATWNNAVPTVHGVFKSSKV